MKVILLKSVPNLGQKGDIKEVNSGYARNFLFEKNLAEAATPQALKKVQKEKSAHEKEEAEQIKHLQKLADEMKGKSLEFFLKSDNSGSVFGSVSKEMILKALRTHFLTKEHVGVLLEHPIKKLGDYIIDIDFKKGIKATLKISVKPETK